MQTDFVDVYLLHFWDPLTPLADVAATLEDLKKQGKIRFYGVSNHTVEQIRAQRRFGRYDVVQPAYSLVASEIEASLLPYCQAESIGVMIYSPLHKGLLTGKYDGTEKFVDFRQHHPDFQGERFRMLASAVRSLGPIAWKYGMSIYQLVLAATLMHPAIHVAIAGIKTRDQILEAAAVMGKTLSREDCFAVRKTLTIDAGTRIKDALGGKR